MLSETYETQLKVGLKNLITDNLNEFLVDYGGGNAMFPFYLHTNPPEFRYYLIFDLDDSTAWDKVEDLIDKYCSEFVVDDFLCCVVKGKTLKSCKFYIGKGFRGLSDALEYAAMVGINHYIYAYNLEKFKFDKDGNIVFSNESF